jgi:alpha-tubulin suppressor-like RCC1 family protein
MNVKIRSLIATCAVLAPLGTLATGCFEAIEFVAPDSLLNATSAWTWHGPSAVDLEDVRDSSSATFYAPYPDATSLRLNASTSYGTFEAAASSTEGALVASFYDGSNFRPFGRAYSPYSTGGTGWATSGTRASYLVPATGTDGLFVALGFSPSGVGMALYSDGAVPSAEYPGNIEFSIGGIWSALTSQVGDNLTTAPGLGYLPSPTFGFAANGSSISTAWDSTGHAYYGYVDQSDTRFVGYVSTYTAFTSWITGNGFRLGPLTSQLRLHNDGFGVVPIWVGQDSLVATSMSLGTGHGCAITAAGLKCWGLNDHGQTGDDTASPVLYPAAVDGIGGTVIQVSTGAAHTCAATQAGSALCWGDNASGQVTGASTTDQVAPVAPSGISGLVRETAAGGVHSCARTASGAVYCWGGNTVGQVGNGAANATLVSPTAIAGLTTASQISAGNQHTCALLEDATVVCWGDRSNGKIGDSGAVLGTATTPVATSAFASDVTQIAAGVNHTCALLDIGDVYCWGRGDEGQIGNGGVADQNAPTQVGGIVGSVTAIASGSAHSCALTTANAIYCWGRNSSGQLGDNTTNQSNQAVLVTTLPSNVTITSISAGGDTSAAITSQGQVLCWGSNAFNQCHGDTALAGAAIATPLETAASANQALHATTSTTSFAEISTLSTGDVKSMSAATDGEGNVVVVFLQTDPGFVAAPTGTISTPYTVRGNDVRVYAAMRGADGTWTGPTRIDDAARFSVDTTTVFQDAWGRASSSQSSITGGIEYPTPAVAYLGSGRFLAAFAMTDLANSKSSIYTRGYSVGSGWDSADQIAVLDTLKLNASTTIEAYRFANDLFMTGNGEGDALLVAHVVVPSDDGSDVTLHNYGMKSYIYSTDNGGWQDKFSQLIPSSICRASADFPAVGDPYLCWGLKPQGMIFPGGEAVVVFPAPAGSTGTSATELRLYSTELHL